MASFHLLKVLRPTCNYRQIYLSRTLPLYSGVFHRHFFSNKRILSSQSLNEAPVEKPIKLRKRRVKPILSSELSSEEPVEEPIKRQKKRVKPTPPSTEEPLERPIKLRKKRTLNPFTKPRVMRRPVLTEEELNASKLILPPIDKWRHYFAIMEGQRLRFFLRNPDTARILAEALVPEGSKDLIVIEAAPGPGQLTRALLDLPKERIKKLIVLEKHEKLLDFLKPLEEADSRFHVFPWASKEWSSYTKLFSTGLLDELQTVDSEKVHPQLRYILHINSTVEGEQLLAQLLRAIPNRHWLFKYGRVPINFILSSRMWDRVRAPTSTTTRCKVSVMAQAVAEMSEAVPYDTLQPFQDHFHPTVPKNEEGNKEGNNSKLDERKTGNPMSAITIIPLQKPLIAPGDLDYWDYCLRKLFVQQATPLNKCISLLGPGAKNILIKLNDEKLPAKERLDTKKNPRQLDLREWALVVRVFKGWAFKPEDLSIDNFFVGDSRHGI